MTPGTSVRVESSCSLHGRTGVVRGVSPWAGLGWLDVGLDAVPGRAGSGILPVAELRVDRSVVRVVQGVLF